MPSLLKIQIHNRIILELKTNTTAQVFISFSKTPMFLMSHHVESNWTIWWSFTFIWVFFTFSISYPMLPFHLVCFPPPLFFWMSFFKPLSNIENLFYNTIFNNTLKSSHTIVKSGLFQLCKNSSIYTNQTVWCTILTNWKIKTIWSFQ